MVTELGKNIFRHQEGLHNIFGIPFREQSEGGKIVPGDAVLD